MTRLFEAKPFVIAEVGSNWETFDHCVDSIAQAKACGADAVKFQAFSHEALYGFGADLLPNALPLDWLPPLADHAKAIGIEFMCTAFSSDLVAAVDPFVEVHKVASSDLSYPQLLSAVAATGKPILLSTGASNRGDIQLALDCLGEAAERTVLMYCVSSYPARSTDLRVLETLLNWFDRPLGAKQIGFSDHSTEIIGYPLFAAHWGCSAIEKHFTAYPELATPDRGHSLTTVEFKKMVDAIRGNDKPGLVSHEEREMFLRHNRRLVASRGVKPGEVLRYGENYGAYRSLVDDGRGITPFLWNHAQFGPEGRAAKVVMHPGQAIGPGDF